LFFLSKKHQVDTPRLASRKECHATWDYMHAVLILGKWEIQNCQIYLFFLSSNQSTAIYYVIEIPAMISGK